MVKINKERLFTYFKEMASISSPSWKEKEMIDYLQKFAKKEGLQFTKIKCQDSYNIMMRLPANDKSKPGLLFSGHTDTVTPCDKVTVIESDTRFTSDGTSILGGDDKAGLAAIMEGVLAIKEAGLPHGEIELLFTCAEEVGLCGMKGMEMNRIKSDFCFVLDSGGPIGSACIKAPYHSAMKVEITGRAAHAGMEPEKGVSAITAMAHIIAALPSGRIDEETTTNIGTVSGGKATNIVAPEANFLLEVRSIDKKKLLSLEKTIKDTVKEKAKEQGVKVKVDRWLEYSGYSIKPNTPILSLFERACEAQKLKVRYEASGGGSDTNILSGAGFKAINLSAGMNKVHTNAEFVKKSDLVKSAELVAAIIGST